MQPREPDELRALETFVAELLQDDIECVSTIAKLLNDPEVGLREPVAGDFSEGDVLRALKALIGREWVKVLIYDPQRKELVQSDDTNAVEFVSTETWFALTHTGRANLQRLKRLEGEDRTVS